MLKIPRRSLVVLIGPSGSGKSTFARRHFPPSEVLSSDACRAMVADDENDQTATKDAFDVLHFIARKRLAVGRLTVVDATNVQPQARKPLIQIARQCRCPLVGIVFDLAEALCRRRNGERADRRVAPQVIRQHCAQLRRSLAGLEQEGFQHVYVLPSPEQVDAAGIERVATAEDEPGEGATPAMPE